MGPQKEKTEAARMELWLSPSTLQACLACSGMTMFFVASLYVWRILDAHASCQGIRDSMYPALGLKPEHGEERDHPITIRKRMYSVITVSLTSPLWLLLFQGECPHRDYSDTSAPSLLETLGIHGKHLTEAVIYPMALVIILFAGSVYMKGKAIQAMLARAYQNKQHEGLRAIRNYLVAPFSEEVVFRCCMLPLLLASGLSHSTAILLCPLFFGVAHVHHILAGVPWQNIVFQACYTTIFGWYAGYLFLRTGHFIAPFLAHAFCNVMEFPPFGEIPHRKDKNLCLGLYLGGIIIFAVGLYYVVDPGWYESV